MKILIYFIIIIFFAKAENLVSNSSLVDCYTEEENQNSLEFTNAIGKFYYKMKRYTESLKKYLSHAIHDL